MRGATRLQTTAGSAAQQHAVCGITMRGGAGRHAERASDGPTEIFPGSISAVCPPIHGPSSRLCVSERDTRDGRTEMEGARRGAVLVSYERPLTEPSLH